MHMEDQIEHHGVLGMKWGVRRFQPYSTTGGRKSGKKGKEVGDAAKRKVASSELNAKVNRKFTKLSTKIDKAQNKATKLHEKAERKAYSVFSTKRGRENAVINALNAQRKVDKLSYSGKRYYEKMVRRATKKGLKLNNENQAIGKQYLDEAIKRAKRRYNDSMNRYMYDTIS